eukprot:1138421-Pelagomonas_calceolata.AAC.4
MLAAPPPLPLAVRSGGAAALAVAGDAVAAAAAAAPALAAVPAAALAAAFASPPPQAAAAAPPSLATAPHLHHPLPPFPAPGHRTLNAVAASQQPAQQRAAPQLEVGLPPAAAAAAAAGYVQTAPAADNALPVEPGPAVHLLQLLAAVPSPPHVLAAAPVLP